MRVRWPFVPRSVHETVLANMACQDGEIASLRSEVTRYKRAAEKAQAAVADDRTRRYPQRVADWLKATYGSSMRDAMLQEFPEFAVNT